MRRKRLTFEEVERLYPERLIPGYLCVHCGKRHFDMPSKGRNINLCRECIDAFTKKLVSAYFRGRRAQLEDILEVFSIDEWERKLKETEGICPGCKKNVGIDKLTLDHIFPISKAKKGRIYSINDVQPLCKSCNSRKSNKVINGKSN